jgi:hypothetical protein
MMDSETNGFIEADEDILTVDVSDNALERAAVSDGRIVTLVTCTGNWYNCGWPQ